MARPVSYRDIVVRGIAYDDFNTAARALGVSHSTIRKAYVLGTLDRVGLGHRGVEPMRVRIGGQVFKSAHDAAQHFSVTARAVRQAIADGDADRIGLKRRGNRPNAKPVSIGALTFGSMREASRQLGFKNENYIAQAIKCGSNKSREKILAAAMRYAAEKGVSAP